MKTWFTSIRNLRKVEKQTIWFLKIQMQNRTKTILCPTKTHFYELNLTHITHVKTTDRMCT